MEAIGWTLSALWAYFLVAVLVDNVAHLPMWEHVVTAGGLGAVLFWFGRGLTLRWQERNATEDEVALAIERRFSGQIQNRLINTSQLSREAGQWLLSSVREMRDPPAAAGSKRACLMTGSEPTRDRQQSWSADKRSTCGTISP